MSERTLERAAANAPITGDVDATIVGPLGQQVMADSVAVVIASDQSNVPVYGKRVAREAHRASAALPAAGAFTSHAAYAIPDGVKEIVFYVTYARSAGVAGCYPQFKVEFGNGTETAVEDILVSTSVTAAASATASVPIYQGRLYGPTAPSDTALKYAIRVRVGGGVTTVALQAAELGAVGTPGTMAIALTGSY